MNTCIYMYMYLLCVNIQISETHKSQALINNRGAWCYMYIHVHSPSQTWFARESASLTEMHTTHNISHADALVTLVTADRRLPSLVAVYLAAAPSTRASESSVMPATDLLAQDTSFSTGWEGREREEWRRGGGWGEEKEGGLML